MNDKLLTSKLSSSLSFFLGVIFLASCSSTFLKYNKEDYFFKNEDFEKQVQIKEGSEQDIIKAQPQVPPPQKISIPLTSADSSVASDSVAKKSSQKNIKSSSLKSTSTSSSATISGSPKKAFSISQTVSSVIRRQPDIEDTEGFINGSRLPEQIPFRVGEKVTHSVKYFATEAGQLSLAVKPMAQVNGVSTYNFSVALKTSRLFSNFYSVDDTVDTYLDSQTLIPYVLKINIKESKKLATSQAVFNHKNLKAQFWQKKYTEADGETETKKEWDILPFSQNAFSGLFYMRVFQWKLGKEISFRVSDDEKNIVFKGTALAKEKLSTDAGNFDAIKIKAQIVSRGALTPAGDIYLWLSDDERKLILRIEAKIKIGSLVSEVIEVRSGQ